MKALLDGAFLDRKENVLAFGNPGSGKTHLLSALGQELIRNGRRIGFTTCARLVQDLLLAKKELRLSRAIKKLAYYEGLVIDDLGYVQQSREEMEVLFTLLAERYERGSVLITSNLPFSKWEAIFKDPMTTAAAIDRLVHHSVILELNIPSYRMEQAKKNQQAGGRMSAQSKGKGLFLNWRLCLQTSGIYRDPAIPGCANQNRRGGADAAPPWSGPGVSAQVASLQSLILCSGQHQCRRAKSLCKAVVVADTGEIVVADREK